MHTVFGHGWAALMYFLLYLIVGVPTAGIIMYYVIDVFMTVTVGNTVTESDIARLLRK
jgi:hypothetical protein